MKILIVHNAYQHRGGEDSVVEAEIDLLKAYGHEVATYLRTNDDIHNMGRIDLVRQTLWSGKTVSDMESQVSSFRPDVVHVHNTFPLISPSLYWAADRLSIPVVQTLHNFRLFCLGALLMRDGKVCEDCVGRSPLRGVVRRCYRSSFAQSAVLGSMLIAHRALGTWKDKVTRYIALNEFCREKFVEGGLPADKLVIKPNFVDFAPPEPRERKGFLFVGRLSFEKGIDVLARAAQSLPEVGIRVVGSGPESSLVSNISNVSCAGALPGDAVRLEMSAAQALILPSIWYENFPRTLVEAFGCGLPVIASRIGALAELVEDGVTGLLFEPGNPLDLAKKIDWARNNPERMADMGQAARTHYEQCFTARINYEQLMTIYHDAIACVARKP